MQKKKIKCVYIEVFVVCLLILVLICWTVLYFKYLCTKLMAVCCVGVVNTGSIKFCIIKKNVYFNDK